MSSFKMAKRPGLVAAVLVLVVSVSAQSEPDPAAVDDSQVSLNDVDEVYPIAPEWNGKRVLNISEYRMSNKLSSTLVRRFVLAGADYRVENRIGSTIASWIVTGRLKRMLKKHDPSVVIVSLDADVKSNNEAEQYLSWAKTMVEQIGPRICYWVGSRTLAGDQNNLNGRIEQSVAPCRYLRPGVSNATQVTEKSKPGKAQEKKWAERIWRLMNSGESSLARR
ncbi:MAG: hypothetical protein GY854_04590 [Deltaproteobacteria bacterium]|nr:hypothetical protein [Deltaproteobacteria bacterium]